MKLREHDMYGHKITPVVGGYGISVSVGVSHPYEHAAVKAHAYATLFHDSDGFRQALLTVSEEGALNVFPERVDEVEALGNESSEEVQYDRLAGKRLPVMEKENVLATKTEDDGSHWRRLGVKEGMNW